MAISKSPSLLIPPRVDQHRWISSFMSLQVTWDSKLRVSLPHAAGTGISNDKV